MTRNTPAKIAAIRGGLKALTREVEMSDDIETLREFINAELRAPGHGVFASIAKGKANEALAALERVEKRLNPDEANIASMKERGVFTIEALQELEAAERERDSLRKALDDRFVADLRAAKAIFAATGRTQGFPDVKNVVAYYIAEAKRLREQLTLWQKFWGLPDAAVSEHYALRAKLERAKEKLGWYASNATPGQDIWRIVDKDGSTLVEFSFVGNHARATLTELFADTPNPREAAMQSLADESQALGLSVEPPKPDPT